MRAGLAAGLVAGLAAPALLAGPAHAETRPGAGAGGREALSSLVGRSEAEAVRRLGPPADRLPTVDGARLFYETLDAGRIGGRGGDTRAGGPGGVGALYGTYSFRCRTEVVIRDGLVAAFNRTGNDCR